DRLPVGRGCHSGGYDKAPGVCEQRRHRGVPQQRNLLACPMSNIMSRWSGTISQSLVWPPTSIRSAETEETRSPCTSGAPAQLQRLSKTLGTLRCCCVTSWKAAAAVRVLHSYTASAFLLS